MHIERESVLLAAAVADHLAAAAAAAATASGSGGGSGALPRPPPLAVPLPASVPAEQHYDMFAAAVEWVYTSALPSATARAAVAVSCLRPVLVYHGM